MSLRIVTNILSSIIFIILINKLEALRIAIVGGGPSGIFLSRSLREKRGNHVDDIVIFEKADRLASVFDSYIIADGKALDFGPALVPNQFNGVYGKLQDIFDEVNTIFGINSTLTNKPIMSYNFDNKMTRPFMSQFFLHNFLLKRPRIVIAQLLKQLAYQYTVQRDTTDTNGVYEIGICQKGETYMSFAERNNMVDIARIIASFTERAGAELIGIDLTGVDRSCAYMFREMSMGVEPIRIPLLSLYMITSPKHDAIITRVLQSAGFGFDLDTIQTVQTMLNPSIASLPSPDELQLHFDVGYQTIMEHIGEIERINGVTIKVNSEVVDIRKESDNLKVTMRKTRRLRSDSDSESSYDDNSNDNSHDNFDNDDNFEFDVVFLTIRPIDAIQVLQPNSAFSTAHDLYDQAKNEAGSFTSILWSNKNWFSGTGEVEGAFGAYGTIVESQFNLQSATGTEDWYKILENQCFPFEFYRDYADEPFFTAMAYTPRSFDSQNEFVFGHVDDCIYPMMQYLNNVYGLDVDEDDVVATYQKNYYPYIIGTTLESTNWYEKFEAIQGKDGLFFFGEVFSTQGVPNVLRYIDTNIDDVMLKVLEIEAKINVENDYGFNSQMYGLFNMIGDNIHANHVLVVISIACISSALVVISVMCIVFWIKKSNIMKFAVKTAESTTEFESDHDHEEQHRLNVSQ